MFHRGFQMIRTSAGALRVGDWTLTSSIPRGCAPWPTSWSGSTGSSSPPASFNWSTAPTTGRRRFAVYTLLYLTLVAFTAYAHYRLASGRNITWRWVFALCSLDATLISAGAVIGGGFGHYFFHLFYYPVLAGFAVFFTSFRLNMAFVTVVAVFYLLMSLLVGDGIDIGAREEKPLFARIVVMYAVVAVANVISPVRADPVAGGGGKGAAAATGAGRTLPGHSRHDGPVGLHDRPGDRRGQAAGRRLQRGGQDPAGGDLPAVEDRHLAAAAPHRPGEHLRGPGAGPDPGVPRLDLYPGHLGAGGPGAATGRSRP